MNEKIKAARLSIFSNTILTLGKLGVGIHMNSVSVISEAMHSGLDLLAALIAYYSIRESSKPADEHHRYGHGKFENVASVAESLLILGVVVMIVYNAWPRLFKETEIHSLGLGAAVMGISAIVNHFVSRELMRVAKKTESPALAADAWHLRADVYTSLGVFAGIVAIKFTGLTILDPIIAMGISVLILKAAVELIIDSMRSILDVKLPEAEENIIKEALKNYSSQYVEFHDLRTRRSGSQRYVDLHLVVPKEWPISKVHALCEQIEKDICSSLNHLHILIHTEPCGYHCTICNKIGQDGTKPCENSCPISCENCSQDDLEPEKK